MVTEVNVNISAFPVERRETKAKNKVIESWSKEKNNTRSKKLVQKKNVLHYTHIQLLLQFNTILQERELWEESDH